MSLLFRFHVLVLALMAAAPTGAEVPRVVVDIAPVHSIVARVMQGLGEPDLILPPGSTPHTAALRPSQARALQAADLLVWIGPELTPWLEKPVATLTGDADHLALLDAEATLRLVFRDTGEDDHDDEHDHDHHGTDPHAWLDPQNGAIWLGLIADRLAGLDPANAGQYRTNAAAGQAELAALEQEIAATLAPVRDRPFVAFHDAYQYFEARFGLHLAGTIATGDAHDPGPARLVQLRDALGDADIACAFSEPQFNDGLLRTVLEGSDIPVAMLDPMGSALPQGPDLYPGLLRGMAQAIADCAGR